VEKSTGITPAELIEQGECPEHLQYLWGWFLELKHPASYSELSAWAELTNRNLSAWEVKILMKLSRKV